MIKTMHFLHRPTSDALFLSGTSLMALSGLVLSCVLVAWAIGGSDFKDSFYGNAAIVLSFAGFIVGLGTDYFAQKQDHRQ